MFSLRVFLVVRSWTCGMVANLLNMLQSRLLAVFLRNNYFLANLESCGVKTCQFQVFVIEKHILNMYGCRGGASRTHNSSIYARGVFASYHFVEDSCCCPFATPYKGRSSYDGIHRSQRALKTRKRATSSGIWSAYASSKSPHTRRY